MISGNKAFAIKQGIVICFYLMPENDWPLVPKVRKISLDETPEQQSQRKKKNHSKTNKQKTKQKQTQPQNTSRY